MQFMKWLTLITTATVIQMADLLSMKQTHPLKCSCNKNIDKFTGLIYMKLFTLHTSCFTIFMFECQLRRVDASISKSFIREQLQM